MKVFQVNTASGGTLITSLADYFNGGNANDFYSTKNLTNNGGVTFVAGKVNAAFQFGTALDRDLSILDALGWSGGAISMAGWFQVTTAPASGVHQCPFGIASSTNNNNFFIRYTNTGGTLQLKLIRDGLVRNDITSNQTLTTGQWYHLLGRYDGTTTELFLDGVSLGTALNTGAGADANNKDAFSIGNFYYNQASDGERVKGLVTEVSVSLKNYSNDEVTDLRNGGAGQTMFESANFLNFFVNKQGTG